MKQNVKLINHKIAVYFLCDLVYNKKVSLPLSDSVGSEVLDD